VRDSVEYRYHNAAPTWANGYLWPVVQREVQTLLDSSASRPPRAFDLGCGNGATAGMLSRLGFDVVGVDPSKSGIAQAREAQPACRFEVAGAYDDLVGRFGQFPLIVSLEVVEHLFDPRTFARCIFELLEPGGKAIVSTPYHGYWKNGALAGSGKMDQHFTALWDGGHIKFWSVRTLERLLEEAGFRETHFIRVGRLPPLAKSMVAVATRPA